MLQRGKRLGRPFNVKVLRNRGEKLFLNKNSEVDEVYFPGSAWAPSRACPSLWASTRPAGFLLLWVHQSLQNKCALGSVWPGHAFSLPFLLIELTYSNSHFVFKTLPFCVLFPPNVWNKYISAKYLLSFVYNTSGVILEDLRLGIGETCLLALLTAH